MVAKLGLIFCVIAAGCLLTGVPGVASELQWDSRVYDSLASADSSDTIEPGTKITLQNWERYKRFMAYGMQVQYSDKYFWHIGSTPDFTVTVGPTRHIRLPRQYLEDTQKYGGQARLERVDTGGFTMTGYMAGVPFPNPAEPQLGAKVFYNARYFEIPAVSLTSVDGFTIDKFLNVARNQSSQLIFKLSHLSTAGMPVNPPYGTGYEYSIRIVMTAPEQAKYLSEIILWPDDPSLTEELFLFLPALRRPIRLSAAARCAPLLGSDYANDDTGVIGTNFTYKILGEKKILVLWHPNSDPAILYNIESFHVKSSLPGWPKPVLGQWELRDVYVLDVIPLPVMGRYCYGHRVGYIDKETWRLIPGESYDANGKLWKVFVATDLEIPDNQRDGSYVVGDSQTVLNLRETHASSTFLDSPVKIDNEVPAEYRDASVAAFPTSLHGIMK